MKILPVSDDVMILQRTDQPVDPSSSLMVGPIYSSFNDPIMKQVVEYSIDHCRLSNNIINDVFLLILVEIFKK